MTVLSFKHILLPLIHDVNCVIMDEEMNTTPTDEQVPAEEGEGMEAPVEAAEEAPAEAAEEAPEAPAEESAE